MPPLAPEERNETVDAGKVVPVALVTEAVVYAGALLANTSAP